MNKKTLKYIILLIVLAAGAVTAVTGISIGAKKDYTNMLNLTDIEAMVSADGVASLNIDVTCADVEITASNDVSDFEISALNIPRSFLKYSVSNNIFNLKYSFNKWYEVSSIPILMKNKGKIKITVPADTSLQDIQIKSGISKADISYLTAENIYINCGSGNNRLSSINAGYVELNSGSGDTYAENISCERMTLSGGSGNIDITNFQTEKADIKTGTGDASVFGSIKGDCIIESGMGDINAELIGSPYDYSIEVPKGSVTVNGKALTNTTGGDGDYKMGVIPGMGKINISFK